MNLNAQNVRRFYLVEKVSRNTKKNVMVSIHFNAGYVSKCSHLGMENINMLKM
jgi:hypothetical protein